jgi:hypothetical protein
LRFTHSCWFIARSNDTQDDEASNRNSAGAENKAPSKTPRTVPMSGEHEGLNAALALSIGQCRRCRWAIDQRLKRSAVLVEASLKIIHC